MREILFRGKRIDNGEWVEGCGIIATENWVSIFTVIDDIDENSSEVNEIEVIPETVGQYTGLNDKLGNEIFEGDIIYKPVEKITPYYAIKSEHYKIIFRNGSFSYANLRGGTYWSIDDSEVGIDTKSYTIIANIHDNPELLKEIDKEERAENE